MIVHYSNYVGEYGSGLAIASHLSYVLFALVIILFALHLIFWPMKIIKSDNKFLEMFEVECRLRDLKPFQIKSDRVNSELDGGDHHIWSAVTLDASFSPMAAWQQWHSIDPHLFDVFHQLTGESIHNLGDLSRVIDANDYNTTNRDFLQMIKGHLGEFHVHDHFNQLGVVMPDGATFKGVDMWIDGHAANVKTVANATQHLVAHFTKNPDVAAILPFDASHIPESAVYFHPGETLVHDAFHDDYSVIVDTHLSNAEMMHNTRHGIEAARHPGGAFRFPWITLVLTGFAEGRLLHRGDTSRFRAALTTLGTVGSVGAGAYAGKALGGILGSLLAPGLGTVVGSAVGGFLGNLSGQKAVKIVKDKRLAYIFEKFHNSQDDYAQKVKEVASYVDRRWADGLAQIEIRLGDTVQEVKSETGNYIHELAALAGNVNVMTLSAASAHLIDAQRFVDQQEKKIKFWWNFPYLRRHLALAKDSILEWKQSVDILMDQWEGGAREVARLFDLTQINNLASKGPKSYLESFFSAKRELYEYAVAVSRVANQKVLDERLEAVQRSKSLWAEIDRDATFMMLAERLTLRSCAMDLRKEMLSRGFGDDPAILVLDALLAVPI